MQCQPVRQEQLMGRGTTGVVYATSNDKVTKVVDMLEMRDFVGPFCMNHPNIVGIDRIVIINDKANITMQRGKTCVYFTDTGKCVKLFHDTDIAGTITDFNTRMFSPDSRCVL